MSEQNNGTALATVSVTAPLAKGGQHETSAMAVAAQAQALVQARYLVAIQRPRDWDETRIKLLKACARPGFAETAIYSKPVGGSRVEGPSIRFAEEAARAMGNLDVQTPVLYDDNEKRIIQVRVTDLEANNTYATEVTVQKTVERRQLKQGMEVIGSRENSQGQMVYLVRATDDDLLNKQNALVSKAMRTGILRVLPSDIREEAIDAARRTMDNRDAADPDAARKKLTSAFAALGVPPGELKKYLGHDLATCSPAEVADLRAVYTSLKDGEASWAEVMKQRALEDESAHDAEQAAATKSRSQATKDAVKARAKAAQQQGADPDTGEVTGDPEPSRREPGQDG